MWVAPLISNQRGRSHVYLCVHQRGQLLLLLGDPVVKGQITYWPSVLRALVPLLPSAEFILYSPERVSCALLDQEN